MRLRTYRLEKCDVYRSRGVRVGVEHGERLTEENRVQLVSVVAALGAASGPGCGRPGQWPKVEARRPQAMTPALGVDVPPRREQIDEVLWESDALWRLPEDSSGKDHPRLTTYWCRPVAQVPQLVEYDSDAAAAAADREEFASTREVIGAA